MMKTVCRYVLSIIFLGVSISPSYGQSRAERIGSYVAWSVEMTSLSDGAMSLLDTTQADETVELHAQHQIDATTARQRLANWRNSAEAHLDALEARLAVLSVGPEFPLDGQADGIAAQRNSVADLIPRVRSFVEAQYHASSETIAGQVVDWPSVAAAQYAVIQQVYVGQIRQNLASGTSDSDRDPEEAWVESINANMASMILVLEMMRMDWGAQPSEFMVDDPVERLQARHSAVRDHVSQGRRALRERNREIQRSPSSTERGHQLLPLLEQSSTILEAAFDLETEMSALLLETGRRIESEGASIGVLAQLEAIASLEQQRSENQQRMTALAQQMFPN